MNSYVYLYPVNVSSSCEILKHGLEYFLFSFSTLIISQYSSAELNSVTQTTAQLDNISWLNHCGLLDLLTFAQLFK